MKDYDVKEMSDSSKKMKYESTAEKDKKGTSGMKDAGNLQTAADYAHECRMGTKSMIAPPTGPKGEPVRVNGVPMPKETNISSGNKGK
jgi:hypothetical protein